MLEKIYLYIFSKKIGEYWLFVLGLSIILWTLCRHSLRGRPIKYGIIAQLLLLSGAALVLFSLALAFLNGNISRQKNNIFSIIFNVLVISLMLELLFWVFQSLSLIPKRGDDARWAIGVFLSPSENPFNLMNNKVNNPILNAKSVKDVKARFVADPFILRNDDIYYMFFEVYNEKTKQGDIGLSISTDGIRWAYKKIVLDEPFSLSYPCVFRWGNNFYMIPETRKMKSVRLYIANKFPYGWIFYRTLMSGQEFKDNTIFFYDNLWWLFSETGNNDTLRLYFTKDISGSWYEHPKSPVIIGNRHFARPAGNIFYFNNKLYRFAQDDDPYYGKQIWGFEIEHISTLDYKEHLIDEQPILLPANSWIKERSHQINFIRSCNGGWLVYVDGF